MTQVSVSPYSPEYDAKAIPIVDAALLYHDQFTGCEYILVLRNALHVPSMTCNLIPPFIMREQGITVNEVPKIHVDDPSSDDHVIKFDDSFRIPLSLHGTFSYFMTRKPTLDDLQTSELVYLLTPEEFNPHNTAFADNEDRMVDFEGEVADPRDHPKLLLSDVVDDPNVATCALSSLSNLEQQVVDFSLLDGHTKEDNSRQLFNLELASLSCVLCPNTLCDRLSTRREVSAMMSSLGSTTTFEPNNSYLLEDVDLSAPDLLQGQTFQDIEDDKLLSGDQLFQGIYEASVLGQIDPEELMVASSYAKPSQGVQAACSPVQNLETRPPNSRTYFGGHNPTATPYPGPKTGSQLWD